MKQKNSFAKNTLTNFYHKGSSFILRHNLGISREEGRRPIYYNRGILPTKNFPIVFASIDEPCPRERYKSIKENIIISPKGRPKPFIFIPYCLPLLTYNHEILISPSNGLNSPFPVTQSAFFIFASAAAKQSPFAAFFNQYFQRPSSLQGTL
jgi:hypothetical protein